MNLALAIIFLWLGATLLFVAFHPAFASDAQATPGGVVTDLRKRAQQYANAYKASE